MSKPILLRTAERGDVVGALDAITRPDHYYRGMSAAEYEQAVARGYFESDQRYCVPGEGTCFAPHAGDGESYANFGHTDPRKTGKPNFLVEVIAGGPGSPFKVDRHDGYPKAARVPLSLVTRVWRMEARGGDLVAVEERVGLATQGSGLSSGRAHAFLPLSTVKVYEAEARRLGVSKVARSATGFLAAYKRAGGVPEKLSAEWIRKREGFIARHMAEAKKNRESLALGDKLTRRHLALIMWAYSPRAKASR